MLKTYEYFKKGLLYTLYQILSYLKFNPRKNKDRDVIIVVVVVGVLVFFVSTVARTYSIVPLQDVKRCDKKHLS